jgi:RNA polymerase sigma-B factor
MTMTLLAAPTDNSAVAAGDRLYADPSATVEQLLRARSRLPAGHPDRDLLRTRAIVGNLSLADRLARRYVGRGEPFDDLAQVAALALVKAVDGYDPDRLVPFSGYAIPTILGALKRHFRDTAWSLRVSRSTQQLALDLPAATGVLAQLRGRTPTSGELADYLCVNVDDVRRAIGASHAYRPSSFDDAHAGHDGSDLPGATDPQYAVVDQHLALRPLLAMLAPRERRIVFMRYFDEMTQARIAAELGISQMHVSRLLQQSLARLRIGVPARVETPAVR